MFLNGALCSITFLLDMQHDNVLKKLNLDVRGGGSAGKIFATMLLHL